MILTLSRDLSFFQDDLALLGRAWTVDGLLGPVNEHWSSGILLVYGAVARIAGTSSYLPFMAAVVVAHLFAGSGVYALVRSGATERRAVAATALFLVFGAGWEVLFWAAAIGFAIATGLGCWAIALARRRPALAAGLLSIAVATSGVGLAFIAGAVVRSGPGRRTAWLLLPVAAYLGWLATFGAHSLGTNPITLSPAPIAAYVATGVALSFGSVLAPNIAGGALILVLVLLSWRHERPAPVVVAALATMIAFFTITAVVRVGGFGVEEAGSSRYFYVAAPLVLVTLASLRVSLPRPAVLALVALAFVSQIAMLVAGHATQLGYITRPS